MPYNFGPAERLINQATNNFKKNTTEDDLIENYKLLITIHQHQAKGLLFDPANSGRLKPVAEELVKSQPIGLMLLAEGVYRALHGNNYTESLVAQDIDEEAKNEKSNIIKQSLGQLSDDLASKLFDAAHAELKKRSDQTSTNSSQISETKPQKPVKTFKLQLISESLSYRIELFASKRNITNLVESLSIESVATIHALLAPKFMTMPAAVKAANQPAHSSLSASFFFSKAHELKRIFADKFGQPSKTQNTEAQEAEQMEKALLVMTQNSGNSQPATYGT